MIPLQVHVSQFDPENPDLQLHILGATHVPFEEHTLAEFMAMLLHFHVSHMLPKYPELQLHVLGDMQVPLEEQPASFVYMTLLQ
jgi:hypothetical protein